MLRILHAADLHLDSPFASLPPEQAVRRRKQQRQLLQEITGLCGSADLVLLAGDVFDDRQVRPETVELLQQTFQTWRIPVFIAPGNHDPYTEQSVWAKTCWPDNVHIFTGAMDMVELPRLRCRVWGAAFRGREAENLLRPIPRSRDGWLEIGVFHGDPVYDGPYHPISRELLESCGLDYLALGHIHKMQLPKQIGRTSYGWPGAAMGRGFDETGEKGLLLVALDRGICETKFIPLSQPRYTVLRMPADQIVIPPNCVQTICRLILTGESEPVDLEALHDQLADQFLHLELRDETVPRQELWADCGSGTLRGLTLQTLKVRYDAAETAEERQLAVLAARYALAALEGREMP